MRTCTFLLAIFASLVACQFAYAQDIDQRTRTFLDAYAHGDKSAVLSMVDDDVTVYGSDLKEVFKGKAGVEKMLADDLQLWGGGAKIGAMDNVSVVRTQTLESICFNAPFSVGDRQPIPVRFSIVWRKGKHGWKLVQSSNVVPTQGQSAAELLHKTSR